MERETHGLRRTRIIEGVNPLFLLDLVFQTPINLESYLIPINGHRSCFELGLLSQIELYFLDPGK